MKIISLNITEYASIKNRTIDFAPGLNIIEGENESGKSTVLSFIKFILYGLPRRSSGEVVSEKERSFSWDGGVAIGSMTVQSEEGIFRIERSAREGMRGDKVSIIDADGVPCHKGEVPGELFLGVPMEVFESTAFVRQLSAGSIDGSEVGSALQNLLLSADETLDSEKAVSKIESVRRRLLHKTRQGGSIYELTKKRDEYASKLHDAKEKGSKIIDYEASYASLDKLCREARSKLAETKRLCDAYDTKQKLIRFDSLRSAKARVESIQKDIGALYAEKSNSGFVPDAEYQRSVLSAEKDYSAAAKALSAKEREYEKAKAAVPSENEKMRLADSIIISGGSHKLASDIVNKEKKAKGLKSIGIISAALSLICFAFAAITAAEELGLISFPNVLSFLRAPHMATILGVPAVILFILSVVLFKSASNKKKSAKALRARLGISDRLNIHEIISYLDSCIAARDTRERLVQAESTAEKELAAAHADAEECKKTLFSLLEKTGTLPEGDKAETVSAFAMQVIEKSEAFCSELDVLEQDLGKYYAVMEERERDTAELDEAELRASVPAELEEKLSKVNISMLRREYEFLRSKAESAEQKRYFYDRELIGLRATGENPLRLEALLCRTENALNDEKLLHDALTLASDTIKEASEAMKRNVTPRLRALSSSYMSRFTDGKYTELGLTSEFKITVNAGGITRPIEALSAGTRDAAYLSLRLALARVLYRGERPPLLFDEVLSQIDNRRAAALLSMLSEVCLEDEQCLIFSCHTRESEMIDANTIKL